jgi:hypothetical protein
VNFYAISLIFSLFVFLLAFILVYKKQMEGEGTRIRYRMLCRNCGWEWLSKTTHRGYPHVCPKCKKTEDVEVLDSFDTTKRRDKYYNRNHI